MKLTFGRYPTRYEMQEYYTRDDVLEYISDASSVRKVVLSFKDEPSIYSEGGTPPLTIGKADELKSYLLQEFSLHFPEDAYPYDKPLGVYPSFHFITKGNEGEPWDFIMEADCQGWRRSFTDVRGAVEILHSHNVPFIAKFSGHRSLHLIIPREAFPEELDGKPIGSVWKRLDGSLRTLFGKKAFVRQAHGTGGILRLPYSLNENLGMVSLPISYEEIDTFRPWESFHHLVQVKEKLSDFIQECKEKSPIMDDFLHKVLRNEPIISPTRKMQSISIVKKSQYIQIGETEKSTEIWQCLPLLNRADDSIIQGYREESPDIRWFIAESLIGDERSFELLPESDEYARCAIEDSIALQAHKSIASFFDRIQGLGDRNLIREMRSILERLDFGLLEKELLKRCDISDEKESLRIITWASVISSVFDNWQFSEQVIQKITGRFPDLLSETDRKIALVARDLETWDEDRVREAQRVLIEAGDRAVDHISLLMTSTKFWVRQRAMEVITKLNNSAFMECIIEALGDSKKIRNMAMSSLIAFGEIAKPFVEEAANVDNPIIRATAIRILGFTEGKESIDIAINGLKSTNIKVKTSAIKSLRKMDDERAYKALRSALWDAKQIGINAAIALANLGENGIKVLKDAMVQAKEEGSEQVLRCIAFGLANVGDDSGIEYLISALYDDSWTEWGITEAIAKLEIPNGSDIFLDYLKRNLLENKSSPHFKVRDTIRALRDINDERILPLVELAIPIQKDKKLLQYLICLLSDRATKLKERESLFILLKLVKSDNRDISQRAGNELMKIGRAWLLDIEKSLNDIDKNSRQGRLLGKIVSQLSSDKQ